MLRTLFQFQTGAIKSDKDAAQASNDVPRFNSKLVRLKGGKPMATILAFEFQFQTGAIKRWALYESMEWAQIRFNSKLVRLKENRPKLTGYNATPFQFQTGAIKS